MGGCFSADQGAIALSLFAFVHTAVVRSCSRPQSGAAAQRPCCELEAVSASGGRSAGDAAGVCAGPLGAQLPAACALFTAVLVALGLRLRGDLGALLIGFSGSWLAGAVFWGWLRLHPLWHLPVEAFALPLAIAGLQGPWRRAGQFYLGALIGTACTDAATALCGLMPLWPQVLQASPSEAPLLLSAAAEQVLQPGSLAVVGGFAAAMVACGALALASRRRRTSGGSRLAQHLGCGWPVSGFGPVEPATERLGLKNCKCCTAVALGNAQPSVIWPLSP